MTHVCQWPLLEKYIQIASFFQLQGGLCHSQTAQTGFVASKLNVSMFHCRVTGTFSCEMDLRKYPFDTQECHLEFESCKYVDYNYRYELNLVDRQNLWFSQITV